MTIRIQTGPNTGPDAQAAREAHEDAMAKAGEAVSIRGSLTADGPEINQPADPNAKPPQPQDHLAAPKTERPEHVPEKFWDAEKGEVNLEALLKAEHDAQAEITRLRQQLAKSGDKSDDTAKNVDDGGKGAPAAGQDGVIAKARAEFAEKGELSDEMYAELEKIGLDRETVDTYIEGATRHVQAVRNAAFEAAGGEEQFRAMQKWAAENLSEEDILVLDALLTHSDPKVVARGAAQLAERYRAEADIEPTVTIHGSGGNDTSGVAPYKSSWEMQQDMRDPRYRTDPAFRAQVEAKLARTPNEVLFGA